MFGPNDSLGAGPWGEGREGEIADDGITRLLVLLTLLYSDDLGDVLNVNVVGAHRVTRAFLPLLRKGTGKKVANM